ncbi:MAG TPA: alkaline phosphatase family protein [Conexibacter sp.]|jgi:hypothetical protein|nr:alkaline phosphatase family protein [Conexibacter sp.]
MTPLQLRLVAALSLACTLVVLVAGAQGGTGAAVDGSALVAERRPVTVEAPGLGSQAAASTGATDSGGSGGTTSGSSTSGSASSSSTGSTATGGGSGTGASAGSGGSGAGTSTGGGSGGGSGTGTSAGGGGRGGAGGGSRAASAEPQPTKIRHVFLIVLAGHGFDATFGAASPAAYLNRTLRPKGALLSGYASLGGADLPDELAMIGGQPPNADTRAGCPTFREFPPSSAPSRTGEIGADGCVFPNTVTTVADQLSASRRTWRAYVEDLDKAPPAAGAPAGTPPKTTCRHPESNAPDDTLTARPGDGYATRHNPFVYYHSLLDLGDCDANDGALTQLEHDLRSVKSTASLSFVAPNLCNAGSESPCVDGRPGGLAAADAFLATWVPKILASPAYRADGLLVVAFAGAVAPPAGPAAGTGTSTSTTPAAPPAPSDQPVRNGALLVSRYAQAGSTAAAAYDPYSLLRSLEDLFALRPLARAAKAGSFAPTVLGKAYLTPPSDG